MSVQDKELKGDALFRFVAQEDIAKRKELPDFKAGDTVNVHVKIIEGNKERVQQFQGVVIQRRNTNTAGETFTVRKISGGVGVERIFPLLSPNIAQIDIVRHGKVRQSRIYYQRQRFGKSAKIKERRVVS